MYINDNNLDILALSETWLSTDLSSVSLSVDRFNIIRRNRGPLGECVDPYIKNSSKYKVILSDDIEELFAKLSYNDFSLL